MNHPRRYILADTSSGRLQSPLKVSNEPKFTLRRTKSRGHCLTVSHSTKNRTTTPQYLSQFTTCSNHKQHCFFTNRYRSAYPGQLQITYPRRSLTPVPQNQSVRPRVIRPPTPNLSLYPALLPPIKRSRSADSPPTSPISTALTTYHSEESLPNEKRNKLVNNIILYQYAVNNSQTTINNVQIQISNCIDKKQTPQLQQLIRIKRSEHKNLKDSSI